MAKKKNDTIDKEPYKHYLMERYRNYDNEVELLKQENQTLKQIIKELEHELTIQQIGYNVIQKGD